MDPFAVVQGSRSVVNFNTLINTIKNWLEFRFNYDSTFTVDGVTYYGWFKVIAQVIEVAFPILITILVIKTAIRLFKKFSR